MSRAILLMGTSELEPTPSPLAAGPLSASFDRGQLRHVRWRGVEILRALSFLVRTPGWGTPAPEISDLVLETEDARFHVAYDAVYRNAGQEVRARLSFTADAEGRLRAEARLTPLTTFTTNRSGFVVLHPLDGFAGTVATVEHADSQVEAQQIPAAISPGQPVFSIRAITHRPVEELSVETRFGGDVFEMEDHRNWSDASFKTYSRPIGLPYPYDLAPGEAVAQTVDVTVREARPIAGQRAAGAGPARIEIGRAAAGTAPALQIGLDAETAAAGLPYADRLSALGPFEWLYRHDPGKGDDEAAVEAVARLAGATGRPVSAELILVGGDDADKEIARFAEILERRGLHPTSVGAFPAADRRSFQPGEPRPPAPDEATIAAALRRAFPVLPIVGGTPAFFTELNRKRPPAGLFDVIAHATAPTVHAADDLSVIETLESLPHIVASARRLAAGAAYRIGLIGIGARLNPYGPGPTPNPGQARVGLADADPRQRGLFAAAWHLGYAATVAPLGVATLALGAPVGPFGLVSTPQPYPRAVWDDVEPGSVYPLHFVAADLAEAAGRSLLAVPASDPRLATLAYLGPSGRTVLIANLSPAPVALTLAGLGRATWRRLDAESALRAALDPKAFERLWRRSRRASRSTSTPTRRRRSSKRIEALVPHHPWRRDRRRILRPEPSARLGRRRGRENRRRLRSQSRQGRTGRRAIRHSVRLYRRRSNVRRRTARLRRHPDHDGDP